MKRARVKFSSKNACDGSVGLYLSCGHVKTISLMEMADRHGSYKAEGSYLNCDECVEEPMDADDAFRLASFGVPA